MTSFLNLYFCIKTFKMCISEFSPWKKKQTNKQTKNTQKKKKKKTTKNLIIKLTLITLLVGFRIYWLYPQKGWCPLYDTKLHLIVRLHFWGVWSNFSLALLTSHCFFSPPNWKPSCQKISCVKNKLSKH